MTGLLLVTLAAHMATSAVPNALELDEARRWAAARFEGKAEAAALRTGIQVVANNDPVQMNARGGRRRIADMEYAGGVLCAVSASWRILPNRGSGLGTVVGGLE